MFAVVSAIQGNYPFAVFAVVLLGVALYYTRQAWRGNLRRNWHREE